MHAVPCCPAIVYAILLWLYLLSAFGKLNTYIHTFTSKNLKNLDRENENKAVSSPESCT